MSVIDKKRKVFGNIAATKTLTEGMPQLKLTSSFPSINNGGDAITFLTDLIKSLIGFDALVGSVVNMLTHSLPTMEKDIKIALKQELKNIVSCGVDPSLPNFLSTTGIVIEVSNVDYLEMFKVDPDSPNGKLMYNDVTSPLTNSSDFNTFLYGVIQDDGNPHVWANILEITFNSIGTGGNPNNTFTIKKASSFSGTLTDLNNQFIDSLTLFNTENIVNRIVDIIFGSISVSVNKTKKQLEKEAAINNVVDCMVNTDEGDTINDSYFTFTNDEVYVHQQEADLRQKGITKLECCNKIAASVPVSMLTGFTAQMSTATSVQVKQDIVTNSLNAMAEQTTTNATNPADHTAIKLNFFQGMISNLIKAIVGIVLSPKVIMIFLVNYSIIYGTSSSFNGPIDFIKKNKNLFHNMMKKISSMIIKLLVSIALKKIAEMVAATAIKIETEKAKNQLSQLLSLVGIPQDTLRLIKGLL